MIVFKKEEPMAATIAFAILGLMTVVFGGLTVREGMMKKAGR